MPLFHAVALTFTCAATPIIVYHGTPKSRRIERSTLWRTKITADFVPAFLTKIEMPLPDHVSIPKNLTVPATVHLCYQDGASARKLARAKRVEDVVLIANERVRVTAQFSKAKNADLRKAIKETGVIGKRDVMTDLITALVVGELLKEKKERRRNEENQELVKPINAASVRPPVPTSVMSSSATEVADGSIRSSRRYSARIAAKATSSQVTIDDIYLSV